jgi:uncharacterized membrane protein YqhA
MKTIERLFEGALWRSRYIVVVAVVASLLVAVGVLFMTTVDVVHLAGVVITYGDPALSTDARAALQLEVISDIIAAIDGYLLSAVLLIFALGLYELFVNKIDEAEGSEFARRLLLIRNLDDLKDRLARVILLILIVKFLQLALKVKYQTTQDLLFLSIGIILVGGAIYISHLRSGPREDANDH